MRAGVPTVAWLDGRVVPWIEATVPIEDRGLQFSESLYEVIPVTAGRTRMLPAHRERMRAAAVSLGLERGVPDLAEWERLAGLLVGSEGLDEGLLYAQVTGGSAPRSHVVQEPPEPTFFAYVRSHLFPREPEAARGIRAITLPDERWARCDLKTTMLLPAVLARREAVRRGVDEALLLGPDGEVREGSTSTVFLVEGRRVASPARGHRVLAGTTGAVVSRLAREGGWSLTEGTLRRPRLFAADEVFITSTSRLVMAVVSLDGSPVGSGRPGLVALDLARRLRVHLELEAP